MMKLFVLCCLVAATAARAPVYFAPAAHLLQPHYNYRGPLSLAPGQPANILAADGRPLDTLDVNLDRSAHFVAKALDNASRVLKKRSVTRLAVAPGLVGFSAAVAAGNVAGNAIATNPIGLTAPLVPGAFVAGPFGLSAPLSAGPLAVSAPVAAGSALSTPPVAGTPFLPNF